MRLDTLKPLLDHRGPLTTVSMDVTRADEAGDRELRGRWNGLRRGLERHRVPKRTLDALAEVMLRPTHVPGPHGRFVVAAGDQILYDRVLAGPPTRDVASHDGLASLLPAAQAEDQAVRYLLVEVDRSGADLTWSGTEAPGEGSEVSGGHDVLHKARAGGWSHKRMQSRAEDSWERNAAAVAAELDRSVVHHRPELVMITGDVRAVALILAEVGKATLELLVEVPGGSRAEGVKEDAFAANVHQVLQGYRARRREQVVGRLREAVGRGAGAVTGLGDVVAVLRRSQVAELVVGQDASGRPVPLAERQLWVARGPLELALRRGELVEAGTDVQRMPADVALLRAAVAQDAGVTFAGPADVHLVDGIGALLRWSDPATPHEGAPSYGNDPHRRQVISPRTGPRSGRRSRRAPGHA